jgi:hypothetical protein
MYGNDSPRMHAPKMEKKVVEMQAPYFRQVNFSTLFMAGIHGTLVEQTAALSNFTAYATGPTSVSFTVPFTRPFTAWPPRWELGAKNHRFEIKDLIQDRGRNGINRGILR